MGIDTVWTKLYHPKKQPSWKNIFFLKEQEFFYKMWHMNSKRSYNI